MRIQVSDPFITTLVGTPLTEGAAAGSSALDTPQRGAVIGEVIPIVFCRRVGSTGGALISPPATEARFEDAANGNITASYHLVLSEGQIDSIQVRDVFQRSCRVGSFTQTYSRRAGTFIRGNFINNSPDLEAPYYCGTGGTYAGLSTMAYSITIPAGFDYWNRQVHCFVRGGMHVNRLLDSVTGPSNNVADLLRYLLANSSKVSADQIDTTSLLEAARFTDTNGLWFNGVVAESTNVRDWMSDVLPYFLLRSSRVGGKEALRPLLPTIAATGAINTGAVSWSFTFTEEHIVPGSFQISYTLLADRKPFCALVLWRQQPTDDIGLIRSTEVRYAGTAENGPFEQHDLSAFCASEDHAVKVGAYILARRKHITHTLSITVRPDAFNATLGPGDLVRVRLERIPSTGASSLHDELYEVDRIGKSLSGKVQLELTQFPVDDQLRSVVALEVSAAVGNGILLPTGKTGVTCDVNSSTDTSVPTDTAYDIDQWETIGTDANGDPYTVNWGNEDEIDQVSGSSTFTTGASSEGLGEVPIDNPTDSIGGQPDTGLSGNIPTIGGDVPRVDDTVQAPTHCEGGRVTWYRLDPSAPGGKNFLTQGSSTYTMVINDVDYSVYSEVECPDPASPTGYGPAIPLGQTGRIYPAPALPDANVYGTYSPTDWTFVEVQSGVQWSGSKLVNSVCTAQTSSGGSGSGNFKGIKGMRLVKTGGPGTCGGYLTIALQIQNAAGTWSQIASIGGGGTDWISFVGSINMSSSAPDAIPAYLGNFGGTSNPP